MGCMLLLLEYYGLPRSAGRGCHHDNGVAKGAGTTSGKGKECACNEPGACMSSGGSVRAYVRAVARAWWRGWGQAEYYGLSVAR